MAPKKHKKRIWVGHYGCPNASRLVKVAVRGSESNCRLTLRPHWMRKWRVPECPVCGEEHDAVHPMWRHGTSSEWESAFKLHAAWEHNPVKVIKRGKKHIGNYFT